MNRRDLDQIDRLFSVAAAVIPMRDIAFGNNDPRVIGLRHDVDDNPRSLDTALRMAEWERSRGYRSTYFLLHGSSYWPHVQDAARELVELGHEVGLHNNAIAESLRQRRDPFEIIAEALHDLRCAVRVTGTVAHGDESCYANGVLRFVNDEIWMECRRRDMGPVDRKIESLTLSQRSLWDFGLKYESNWLKRGMYLSDSGRSWSRPVDDVFYRFGQGQLHMLVHPDWWADAFVAVAA